MRIRTLVLLLLAVILAGGTAYLARVYIASQRTEAELKAAPVALPKPARSVLVARADIKRGQILRPDDMVWQVWPEGGIDKNYVLLGGPQKPETFAGWVARNPITGGEPITTARIIAPGDRGFLAAVLRPGMVAISLQVTVTSGISGFIFPGDLVDMLLTISVPPPAASTDNKGETYTHKATETVLRGIRVIAIDQRLESKAGEAVPAHTATFEVTPKQSQIITLANEIGKVSLTLRSLVPGSPETSAENQTVAAAADHSAPDAMVAVATSKSPPDSSVGANTTYTMDSELSPLLPQVQGSKDASQNATVTILRGAAKTNESAGLSKLFGALADVTKTGE